MLKTDGKPPKLYVIDPSEESRVPYLRGILTRSLQDAGLPFEEAYNIANEVRKRLWSDAQITLRGNEADISADELKRVVAEYLSSVGADEVRERYLRSKHAPIVIQVIGPDGQPQPYSKALLAQTLETCALPAERSYAITSMIEQELINSGCTRLTSREMTEMTYRYLLEQEGKEAANRYLAWIAFTHSGRPLILLVGGSTGSGKSTISSEVAHRLNIVRTQSTDMLREVMRLMVPRRLIPTLHTSSYNAWKVLPKHEVADVSFEVNMIDGYLTQAEQVGVGIEGVMKRAEREQVSLILEGVHIHPRLQKRLRESTTAVVVPIILAVLKKKSLRNRLLGRSKKVPTRTAQRYSENFDAIWQLQSFILSEADRLRVPIITNDVKEETIRSMMEAISDVLLEEYEADPAHLSHEPADADVEAEK